MFNKKNLEAFYFIDQINKSTISTIFKFRNISLIYMSQNNSFSNIQDLLNETRSSLQESMEYDDEMVFTSDMAKNFNSAHQNNVIPNGYSKEDISEEVMSALTKNYSALMKKIDEKKGRL